MVCTRCRTLSRNFSNFLNKFFFGSPFVEMDVSNVVVSRMRKVVSDKDAKYYDLRLWDPPMMQTDSGDVQ